VLEALDNDTSKLVIDLSCRRKDDKWFVATNKWQTITDFELNQGTSSPLPRRQTSTIDVAYVLRPDLQYTSIATTNNTTLDTIARLEPHCSEFLIHAADVEGLQRGIDHELVSALSQWCSIPVTYAGGGRSLEDLELVKSLSAGKVDLTIGSALDIFGGGGVAFEECVKWNERQ
jgi:phosphoribosylformimino-5-aminoimidazole carboxamide ribotide isomerase